MKNGSVSKCQDEFNGKDQNAPNVGKIPYCANTVESINIANHVPALAQAPDTGAIVPHCCQPMANGSVSKCQGEFNGKAGNAPNVGHLPYCANTVESINIANHVPALVQTHNPSETPEAKSEAAPVEKKDAASAEPAAEKKGAP